MKNVFYTIMEGKNYVNASVLLDMNDHIEGAIQFSTIEGAKLYLSILSPDRDFRIVKVNCNIEEITD